MKKCIVLLENDKVLENKPIKIALIGAGSIGSLFGGYLASVDSGKHDTEVVLFCRKDHAHAVKKNGLILHDESSTIKIKNIKVFENIKQFQEQSGASTDKIFNFLFLTTKTYDIESALTEYKELVDLCGKLVILQNGIGNEDLAKLWCSEKKIFRIVTTNGALIDNPGHVVHTGKGITKLGHPFLKDISLKGDEIREIYEDLTLLSELLNSAGLETILVEDIIKECWEKILINVGINALGALTRLNNGKLLMIVGLKSLMGKIVQEAEQVAKLKNIKLSDKNFVSLTWNVAEKTAENKNSMLQDVLKGKKTEIDFINGKIVSIARALGVKAPLNELLTYLIKGLELSLD